MKGPDDHPQFTAENLTDEEQRTRNNVIQTVDAHFGNPRAPAACEVKFPPGFNPAAREFILGEVKADGWEIQPLDFSGIAYHIKRPD